jgi:hypothetical protein
VSKEQRRKLHLPLEHRNLHWYWYEDDLDKFRWLWNRGATVEEMATELKKNPYDVIILILDQADLGEIKPRSMGLGI